MIHYVAEQKKHSQQRALR